MHGIDFGHATVKERDGRVEVWDEHDRLLGTVTADDSFTHSLRIGPYAACGPAVWGDTAAAIANDTRTTVTSRWKVSVDVTCK